MKVLIIRIAMVQKKFTAAAKKADREQFLDHLGICFTTECKASPEGKHWEEFLF